MPEQIRNTQHTVNGARAAVADGRRERDGPELGAYAAALYSLGECSGLSETLEETLQQAKALFGASIASLALVDADGRVLKVAGDLAALSAGPASPQEIAPAVAAAGNAVHVADAARDARYGEGLAGVSARSFAAVPLLTGSLPVGVLALYADEPGAFESALGLLEPFGHQAGAAIRIAQLEVELDSRLERPAEPHAAPQPQPGERDDQAAKEIVAATRHPMALLASDLKIEACNRAFSDLFPPRGAASTLRDYFDPPGLDGLLEEAARAGYSELDADGGRGGDGAEESAAAGGGVLRVAATRISGRGAEPRMLLTIDDVTELRLRETQLLESSRLVAVGEMAAGFAHELNNPLTAVLGFAQLALRQDMEEVLKRDIEAIASEARRAGRIVDNLLSFARRRTAGEMRPFDAAAAVQRVLDMRQYECKVNNIEIVTYFDATTPRTMADPHQMQQVFLNVLNNAIQALSEHRGHGAISVGVVGIGDDIRITLADDGPGIPEDVLRRVFEPFFTTKPVGKGTGLGLAISKSIVESHGGRMRVESRPGKGTTFIIHIPVVAVREDPEDPATLQEAVEPSYTMLRVLVVDDEPAVRELLTRALASIGHEVETVADGAEALRLLYVGDYDVILLDMKMPGLGGPEVYQCVQAVRPGLADRILFVTGDVMSQEARSFAERAGRRLLRKPFTLEELRRQMNLFARAKVERTVPRNG